MLREKIQRKKEPEDFSFRLMNDTDVPSILIVSIARALMKREPHKELLLVIKVGTSFNV